jgi:hypothetical protein
MLLPAIPAEEGRIESRLLIFWIEELTIECHPPSTRLPEGRIEAASAGEELMKFECEKCAIATSPRSLAGLLISINIAWICAWQRARSQPVRAASFCAVPSTLSAGAE